jgi:hypothetical protein
MVHDTIVYLAVVLVLLFLNVLTLEDGNDMLYQIVGNQLATYAA